MEQRKGRHPIGIDFGTAYTRVAVSNGNDCKMIPDENGNSAMPSFVAFTDSGLLVGEAARRQAPHYPTNTIFDVTRLIGRRCSDPSLRNDMRMWPFKVIAGPDDMLKVEVHWKGRLWQFTLVEICSMILLQIKENAEKHLQTIVTDAVITVPVCFNYAQRMAIRQAGLIAGLNFMQILSAPAASAFFYGMQRPHKSTDIITTFARNIFTFDPQEHNMVIIDLGAGTLDVATVTIKGDQCRVRAAAGDVRLGGFDFDNNLVDYFVSSLKNREKEDISSIPMAISKLRTLCENAKISLSSGNIMVPMKITPLYHDVNFDSSITEALFNTLNNDLFSKCLQIIETCLKDSRISGNAVHEVILAGSSTRIPLLQNYIRSLFASKVLTISNHLEAATAYGAAFQSFFLSVRENARAHCLSLCDVAPFSLGLRSPPHDTMSVFIKKNTNIPVKKEQTLQHNYRRQHLLEVYEGEGKLIRENNFLGKFDLTGSQIKIYFEIHENSTLTVTAEEIPYGKKKSITITNNNIKDSKKLVSEALLYKESEKGSNMTLTTKSFTRSGSSLNWGKLKEKENLHKLLSMEKCTEKIMGQSSKQYVQPEEYAVGIDFGTTYSSFAVWGRNGVKIIENESGSRLTCSSVTFTDTGRLVGETIHKEQVTTNPANTISNIKRLIGRRYSDQSVQNESKFLHYKILCDQKNRSMVSVQYKNEEKVFAPEEISAMILSKMKETAEAQLQSKVTKAVISVPASFSDSQRKAIKNAGAIAGLEVMQLLNEPTATAIAYFLQKNCGQSSTEKTLLIFDLGGGNLDVSIVVIKGGSIRVQAVAGDTNLGGEDFDNNMVSHFVVKYMKEKRRDISKNPRSMRRLRAACEKAKRVLSTNTKTMVEIDALDEGTDFRTVLTRKAFEEINGDLFNRCVSCVERCLEDAEMDENSIDEIVLVGGSTRIPKLHQLFQELFKGKEICKSINADEAVVYGAAVQAAILSGNKNREDFNMLLEDVTTQSLGIANKYGETMNLLIPKHAPIPATKELILTTCANNLLRFSVQVEECESASSMVFGITTKQRVKSKINATLEVDISGIVNLTAKEMSSRQKNEIVITEENSNLTKEEIETMVESAARYKKEDDEHKARAAELNSLENFAYKMKAIARDAGVSASSKKLVEKAADDAIAWLETNHHAAIHEITTQKEQLETIKSQVTTAALNSLKTLTNEFKTAARDAIVSASHKKLLEEAADEAIAWLGTNPNAGIDKINAQTMQLETIKSQVMSDALNYLQSIAYEIKTTARNARVSDSHKKLLEEAADEAIAWLETNPNAGIDKINAQTMQLETIKSQVMSDALNYLQSIAYEIKTIARDAILSASHKKLLEEAADEAIAWLGTNPNAGIHEINAGTMHLETIKSQVMSDLLNYLGNIAYEMKEDARRDPRYSASNRKLMEDAADNVITWLKTKNHAGFDEINYRIKCLESTKSQVPLMET